MADPTGSLPPLEEALPPRRERYEQAASRAIEEERRRGFTEDDGTPMFYNQAVVEVQPGDTLEALAEQFYGNRRAVAAMAAENEITDPGKLSVGQKIQLAPRYDYYPELWDYNPRISVETKLVRSSDEYAFKRLLQKLVPSQMPPYAKTALWELLRDPAAETWPKHHAYVLTKALLADPNVPDTIYPKVLAAVQAMRKDPNDTMAAERLATYLDSRTATD